jgi:hypothetical protein
MDRKSMVPPWIMRVIFYYTIDAECIYRIQTATE